ncbi:hypothetical protein [Pontivivens ytuae]|uniref:Uncharacterized protein n=1 Tax=Pontivivens ytuae TaxID=2789856 RepID=A0A7S9LS91_9RHOB|nr:hypothetical protein [Pontivivens ytuae]QPH54362.1 hypothetical protein I0K15_00850 [Pontivivens ytuae]
MWRTLLAALRRPPAPAPDPFDHPEIRRMTQHERDDLPSPLREALRRR